MKRMFFALGLSLIGCGGAPVDEGQTDEVSAAAKSYNGKCLVDANGNGLGICGVDRNGVCCAIGAPTVCSGALGIKGSSSCGAYGAGSCTIPGMICP